MSDKFEKMSVFEQLRAGLEDGIAFSKGELSLKTVAMPSPPPKASARAVTRIRKRLRMSQAVFAATLNVSAKTVQSWEQGTREPSDAALRLLQVFEAQPGVADAIVGTANGRNGNGKSIRAVNGARRFKYKRKRI